MWVIHTGRWQDVLPADTRVDHVITDPQYEEEAHTKQRRSLKDATQKRGAANTGEIRRVEPVLPFPPMTPEERAAFGVMAARSCRRWVVAFCQIEGVDRWKVSLTAAGLEWIRGGIWVKPDGMPQFTGDRPGQGFESLSIAHPKGRKRWNGGGKHAIWTCSLEHGHGNGTRNEHPTQKPIRLMAQLIEDFTDPGDTILDPYCGSGTTGVACLRLGRHFIGCEMSTAYAEIARERLRAEETNSTLEARRHGQGALFG